MLRNENSKVYNCIINDTVFIYDMIKRVCVYIDGANFYGGLTSINKRFSDTKFDFEDYIKYLTGKEKLVIVNYYNAWIKKRINEKIWQKQKDFFDRLRKIPKFKVNLCTRKSRLNILGEEYHTIKGDDLMLALDMIEDCYNNKFDKVILFSGDGDFTELLKRVKKKSKEIEVCYFDNCVSRVLLSQADKTRLINKKIANKFFWREKAKAKKEKQEQQEKLPVSKPETNANNKADANKPQQTLKNNSPK